MADIQAILQVIGLVGQAEDAECQALAIAPASRLLVQHLAHLAQELREEFRPELSDARVCLRQLQGILLVALLEEVEERLLVEDHRHAPGKEDIRSVRAEGDRLAEDGHQMGAHLRHGETHPGDHGAVAVATPPFRVLVVEAAAKEVAERLGVDPRRGAHGDVYLHPYTMRPLDQCLGGVDLLCGQLTDRLGVVAVALAREVVQVLAVHLADGGGVVHHVGAAHLEDERTEIAIAIRFGLQQQILLGGGPARVDVAEAVDGGDEAPVRRFGAIRAHARHLLGRQRHQLHVGEAGVGAHPIRLLSDVQALPGQVVHAEEHLLQGAPGAGSGHVGAVAGEPGQHAAAQAGRVGQAEVDGVPPGGVQRDRQRRGARLFRSPHHLALDVAGRIVDHFPMAAAKPGRQRLPGCGLSHIREDPGL